MYWGLAPCWRQVRLLGALIMQSKQAMAFVIDYDDMHAHGISQFKREYFGDSKIDHTSTSLATSLIVWLLVNEHFHFKVWILWKRTIWASQLCISEWYVVNQFGDFWDLLLRVESKLFSTNCRCECALLQGLSWWLTILRCHFCIGWD